MNYSKLSARRCLPVNPQQYQSINDQEFVEDNQILPVFEAQVRNRNGEVQNVLYPQYQQTDLYMARYNQLAIYNQNMNIQAKVYEDLLNSGMGPYDE